jgi:hypothetical protein
MKGEPIILNAKDILSVFKTEVVRNMPDPAANDGDTVKDAEDLAFEVVTIVFIPDRGQWEVEESVEDIWAMLS